MKGICFIKPLFDATIEGRKTQTRRIANQQPDTCGSCYSYVKSDYKYTGGSKFCYTESCKTKDSNTACGRYEEYRKPRYKVGETVCLKEPYYVSIKETEKNPALVYYKYRDKDTEFLKTTGLEKNIPVKWGNKLSMPDKYARYHIKITAVRCERLQQISDEDCMKEGIIYDDSSYIACEEYTFLNNIDDWLYDTPREAYAALIDKISGKGTWESNPYVWVYDYKLINNK